MPQNLYSKTTVDAQTGELQTKEWITKTASNAEQFIRMYTEDICLLAKCSGAEQSVVLCCMQYLDYDTNELVLNPQRRKNICECGNIKLNTVNTAISRLYKKNIFIRKDTKTFLNPKLFFYGSDIARNKLFKLEINYRIEHDSAVIN